MNSRRRLVGDGPANGLRSGGSMAGFDPGTILTVDATGRAAGYYMHRLPPNGFYIPPSAYGTIAANSASFGVGTWDFSVAFRLARVSWASTSTGAVLAPSSGSHGIKVNILSGRIVQLQIGNGTDFTTYSYSFARALPDVANWANLECAISADRDGLATLYVGAVAWDTVSIATSAAQSVNSVEYYLGRDGSSYLGASLTAFGFANYAVSAASVAELWRTGPSPSDQWGSYTAFYTMDASAGLDGWAAAATRVTSAGNIDAVSDGSVSKDNTIRTYANAATNTHYAQWDTTELGPSKRYRVLGSIYIPNSGGSTYLDGAWIALGQSVSGSASNPISVNLVTTLGAWTDFSFEGLSYNNINGSRRLSVFGRKSGSANFTGANSVTDDLFYIHGFVAYQLGWTCWLDGSEQAVNHHQWRDRSTNQADATMTNASMIRPRAFGRVRFKTNTNGNQQALGQAIIPAGSYISHAFAKQTGTSNRSLGTSSGGTQIVASQSITTAWARPTQSNIFVAAASSLYVAAADTNVTDWEVEYLVAGSGV